MATRSALQQNVAEAVTVVIEHEELTLVSGPMTRGHAPGVRHVLQVEARARIGQDEAVVATRSPLEQNVAEAVAVVVEQKELAFGSNPMASGHAPGVRYVLQVVAGTIIGQQVGVFVFAVILPRPLEQNVAEAVAVVVKQEDLAFVSGPMARGHAPGVRYILQVVAGTIVDQQIGAFVIALLLPRPLEQNVAEAVAVVVKHKEVPVAGIPMVCLHTPGRCDGLI